MVTDFTLSTARLKSLRTGKTVVPERAAIFRIEGSGALQCLQGLLTSDLAAAGDGSIIYGALLTSKGMIVVDPWVMRQGDRFVLVMDAHGRDPATQLLGRVLPPRLARITDLSDQWTAAWALGSCGFERLVRAAGAAQPGHGKIVAGNDDVLVAGGSSHGPFHGLLVGPGEGLNQLLGRAASERGDAADLAAARVLAGWPTLGREIDERTLPQEVRFDELGAVSYVKGCYTGQETVARVHFRGHVNRILRGLRIEGAMPLDGPALKLEDREVGTIRTVIRLEDHQLGLALLRREIEEGTLLRSGDRAATVVPLPFNLS
jgi:folate-binding protein YgfZ